MIDITNKEENLHEKEITCRYRNDNFCNCSYTYFSILPNLFFSPFCDHRVSNFINIYDRNFQNIFENSELKKPVFDKVTLFDRYVYTSYQKITIPLKSLSAQRRSLNTFSIIRKNKCLSLNYKNFINPDNSYN